MLVLLKILFICFMKGMKRGRRTIHYTKKLNICILFFFFSAWMMIKVKCKRCKQNYPVHTMHIHIQTLISPSLLVENPYLYCTIVSTCLVDYLYRRFTRKKWDPPPLERATSTTMKRSTTLFHQFTLPFIVFRLKRWDGRFSSRYNTPQLY